MSSARRHVKRAVSVAKKPASASSPTSRLTMKRLVGCVPLVLLGYNNDSFIFGPLAQSNVSERYRQTCRRRRNLRRSGEFYADDGLRCNPSRQNDRYAYQQREKGADAMSSTRRRVKRTIPVAKQPNSVQPMALRSPKKGLTGSVTICLVLALLLVWKFAPANSTPKSSGASASSVAVTSFIGETANTSLPDPSSLLTPVDASDPGLTGNPLPASVPAHTGEPGAKFRRVVDKKIANGMVTLTLKDEQTGELSTITQPLGTSVVLESGGKEHELASTTTSMASHDAVNADLPTRGIETIKAGMTVPTRNPITGKTEFKKVTRTFKHTAYEIVKLELADGATGKVVDSLRGTPEHPFFTPTGMVAMGELKPEMQVITRRGPPLIVKSVTREPHPEGIAVYNFEVEGDHTYFVGKAEGGTWVHNTCLTVEELENAYNSATAPYKGGPLSEAGRALAKHNPVSRPGSAFPIPRGGPTAINDLAHDVVGEILRNPKSIRIDRGAVFDIVAPDGRGMRFFANGAFKGFLEP